MLIDMKRIGLAAILCLVTAVTLADPVGAVTAELVSPLGNRSAGKSETGLGDLVTDSIRSALGTNVSFVTASELKPKEPSFDVGNIDHSDVTPLISYPDDPLAIVELTGTKLREALEKSVSMFPQPNLGFLQVSGLSFKFDARKAAGQRVTRVLIGESEIRPDAIYTVAMSNSLANGALGYWKVWSKDAIRRKVADLTMAKAVERYFIATPRLDYSALSRINPTQ